MIKKIATAGRSKSKEFVTEYIVQYSDNADVWQSYITPEGDEQVYDNSWVIKILALLKYLVEIIIINFTLYRYF